MKPRTFCMAVVLAFGLTAPAHAQDDPAQAVFDGVQSSLAELFHMAAEGLLGQAYRDAVRKWWILNSDIRMWMNADYDATGGNLGNTRLMWWEEAGEGSIYAEFDWQNRATAMRIRGSGGENSVGVEGVGSLLTSEGGPTDVTIYFDAVGNVYVPTEEGRYVSASMPGLFGGMAGVLEMNIEQAIEAGVADMLEREVRSVMAALELTDAFAEAGYATPFPPGVRGLLVQHVRNATYNRETDEYEFEDGATRELLRGLVREFRAQYESLTAFPPLIHFAFIFSPAAVRAQVPVRADTNVRWRGSHVACNDCTRFTVTEGEQAGYVIIFDRYGRLVHLRDTDGSTAEYGYDRDVTVHPG